MIKADTLLVERIIIHKISKESGQSITNVTLSEEFTEVNEESEYLIATLEKSYRKDSVLFAFFDEREDYFFPEQYKILHSNKYDEGSFLEFTKKVTLNLESRMKLVNFAKGGYLIYVQYERNGDTFTSIFLIRDVKGLIFQKGGKSKSFKVNGIQYLNIDKLAMGCRISHEKYDSSDQRYLAFIKQTGQQDYSGYFTSWISASNRESSGEFTNALYDLLNKLEKPKDEKGKELSIDDFREKVYEFVKAQPGKVINLNNLSSHLYNDDLKIATFIDENNLGISTEFKVNARIMKKFIGIDVDKDGIKLKFPRGILNKKVRLSKENPKLVIIESKSFADALRKEINDNE
jgi:nucleoid-associated protein